MTHLLERALAEVAKLPPPEQDQVAEWLLDELRSEHRWASAFASSQDVLESLADEAIKEHEDGRTEPLDPEKL